MESLNFFLSFIFLKIFIYLQRGEAREKETSMCKRYTDWLPLTHPQTGTWPTAQACALTGNQTGDALAQRPALSPLSHSSQGEGLSFFTGTNIKSLLMECHFL